MFNSGASESIIRSRLVKNLKQENTGTNQWKTAAGKVATSKKAKLMFSLPEFYESKIIQFWAHVFNNNIDYDMIIGRDLMAELGIDISFKRQCINWGEAEVPMRDPKVTEKNSILRTLKLQLKQCPE